MDEERAAKPLASLSSSRKIVLLLLFCFAQFLDCLNATALFSAIPAIATSIGLNNGQSVWLYSAYQLSFAALLLISGRMSDIFNSKVVLLIGMYILGFGSLGIGFAHHDIAVLVLRALSGIGAALSIPSSLRLLVHTFPDPAAQAKAVSVYAGCGALGSVLGVVIGALIISYASWPWVFFVAAILALLIAIACTFLIPHPHHLQDKGDQPRRFQKLDICGGWLLISTLVLFIFAVTSGSTIGWSTATVLVPLFLSFGILGVFFFWEARVPEEHAALPPRLWSYPNFAPLAILALLPYAWWGTVYLMFAWYWQEVQSWNAIESGVHFLPLGLFAFPVMGLSGLLQRKFHVKQILLGGLSFMVAGTIFLVFADRANRYWFTAFPGFLLGTVGATLVFATTNIAIFAVTPAEVAGTVGAVFNCALLLGSAVIASVATSLQTSVQPSPTSFKGRSAAFLFLIAVVALQLASILAFMRKTAPAVSR